MGTADHIPERQERNIIPQQIRTMAGSDPSKTNNEIGRSRQAGPDLTTGLNGEDLVPKLSAEQQKIEQLNQNNGIE